MAVTGHRPRCYAVGWLFLLLSGCATAAAPPKAPVNPTLNAPKRATADALHAALSRIAEPPPLLDAAPPEVRAALDKQKAELSAEQRQLLLEANDPIVQFRPLLHLAVGGTDPDVIHLIFISGSAANEMVGLLGERASYPGLAWASQELARRAAQWTLHAHAVDVSSDVQRRARDLEQITVAARFLEFTQIERLALEELLKTSPEQASDWERRLAELAARSLDPDLAKALLARSVAHTQTPLPYQKAGRAAVEQAIVAAERIHAADAQSKVALDPGERVALARNALELGLVERAGQFLDADPSLRERLDYATTKARVLTLGSACPTLTATIATERMCREAWAEVLPKLAPLGLDRAWASATGRDSWSIETYLGVGYVAPMMYGLTRDGKELQLSGVTDDFEAMRVVAEQGASIDPGLAGIALLSRALGLAVAANASAEGPTAIAPEQRKSLLASAQTQAAQDGTWPRAAALGVAAIVAQHEKLGNLLEVLHATRAPSTDTAVGSLLLWDILADADVERFKALKSYFAELTLDLDASAFERSTWLFLWAEAEAQLAPTETTYQALQSIAERLSDPAAPLDLRLRSAIDRAGLSSRKGDFAGAAAILEPIVANTPRSSVSSNNEQELLIVANGYLEVLKGMANPGERAQHAKALEALLLTVTRANAAPPTLQMWLMMWRSEFDALAAKDACKGRVACERQVDRKRGADLQKVSEALGARVAGLLEHGVLPVGGVQIEFSYQASGRLVPKIAVTPQFLLAQVPPFAHSAILNGPK